MTNNTFKLPDNIPDYERGFIDGMQEQMRRSVDKAVNAMADRQKEWQGLTDEEVHIIIRDAPLSIFRAIEAKLREKNT